MHEGSKRAIAAAFLANLGIAIAKFVGFLITGASSMLAESIHSVADTANQGLLFLGGAPGRAAGHGRAPLRLRARALLLVVRRGPRALPLGGAVRGLRGRREDPRTPTRSSRRPSPSASSSSPSCSRSSRCAPRSRRPSRAAAGDVAGGSSSAARRARSCPSCCSRTSARWSAWSSRLTGVHAGRGAPTTPIWDGVGTLAIGVLLVVDRRRPGRRDEEPADRRVGRPRGDLRRSGRPSIGTPAVRPA